MSTLSDLYDRHRSTLDAAVEAIHARVFHAHWPEAPSGKIYGETAAADGEAAFRARLGTRFEELGQDADGWEGAEESPYGFPLGITYPAAPAATLAARAEAAFRPWSRLHPRERAALLVEALERLSTRFFEIAHATMHTTGQGFIMAFQASGPHAFDRALEATALGLYEQTRFPERTRWDKPMGRITVSLEKRWRAVARGTGVVIGCSTFPVWNSVPGLFANLVTGNPSIVKPHPGAVLPLAIVVAGIRAVAAEHGVPRDIVQLAVDGAQPMTEDLVQHPSVRLIDYTGGSAYGEHLERLHDRIVFTEKAGVNSVLLDSAASLDAALENLAFSLSLYAGQMCTTPQNIFISEEGVLDGGVRVPYDEVVRRLVAAVNGLVENEKVGPGTLGAIQNLRTLERIDGSAASGVPVLRASADVPQSGFAHARSRSPLLLETTADDDRLYGNELFGPIACVVKVRSSEHGLETAAAIARTRGAISFAAWCEDPALRERIADEMMEAGVNVSFNLTGPIWMNQSATFSDFHVTGGNPSGNASLTDPAFVTRRFFLAASRIPVADSVV